MSPETIRIAIPEPVLAEVDAHLHLFGSFRSRQELVTYAVLELLDRVEETGAYCS